MLYEKFLTPEEFPYWIHPKSICSGWIHPGEFPRKLPLSEWVLGNSLWLYAQASDYRNIGCYRWILNIDFGYWVLDFVGC